MTERRSCGDNMCLVDRLEGQMTTLLTELKSSQEKMMDMVQEAFDRSLAEVKERIEEMRVEKSESHRALEEKIGSIEHQLFEREGKLMTREADLMTKFDAAITKWHEGDEAYRWLKQRKSGEVWLQRTLIGAITIPALYAIYMMLKHLNLL